MTGWWSYACPPPKVTHNSHQCLCPHHEKHRRAVLWWPHFHPVLCPCHLQVNLGGQLQCPHWLWPQMKRGNAWQAWHCQDEQQWPSAHEQMCTVWTSHHKHSVQTGKQIQEYMDAPQIQAVAYDWSCYCLLVWHQGCPHCQSHVRSRVLDRPHACLGHL